jgi:hypothetical protein
MKQLWLSHGWTDVSAIWGSKKVVPTFKSDRKVIEQWPDFQVAMGEVDADWYYLSGHHGREFSADLSAEDEMVPHFNTHENCGFFNHVYHDGQWEHGDADNPYDHIQDLDVFMRTGNENWGGYGSQTNPLYSRCQDNCRGIFLVGCRALAYKAARKMYTQFFPNAVVIGPVSRESMAINRLMKVCKGYGRDFFVDPWEYDPEELVTKLNPSLTGFDHMAVLRGGEFWFPVKKGVIRQIAADDDIADDIP